MTYTPLTLEKTTNQKSVIVKEGDQFKISCKADGNPVPKIDWYFNEDKIDTKKYEDINIFIKNKRSALYINQVNVKHTGNYTCVAHNNNGFLQKWMYVSVLKKYTTTVKTTTETQTLSERCNSNNCLYGRCSHHNNTVYCKCISSYSGERCDRLVDRHNVSESCLTIQNKKDHMFSDHKVFAFIGFGFSITLVLTLLGLWCLYKFRTKRQPYLLGDKVKRSSDKATQVSESLDCEEKIPFPFPDTLSNLNVELSKPLHTKYPYNIPPVYNFSNIPQIRCCSPSLQSSSSTENPKLNHKIITSMNNFQYPLVTDPVMVKSLTSTTFQPHMIQLDTSLPYLCSPLEMTENISFDNYLSKLMPISFSCTDPSCCLSIKRTMPISSGISDHPYSTKNVISLHSNPLVNDPMCNCKCNIQKVNTFV